MNSADKEAILTLTLIAAAVVLILAVRTPAAALIVALLAVGLLTLSIRRHLNLFAAISLLAVSLTSWMASTDIPVEPAKLDSVVATVSGVVEQLVTASKFERSVIRVSEIRPDSGAAFACRNVRMLAYGADRPLHVGDIVSYKCRLRAMHPRFLSDMLLVGHMRYKSLTLYGCDGRLRTRCESVRRHLCRGIDATHLTSGTKGLLKALLLGDKSDVDPQTRTLFADSGISHILAVSGMHVGIITMLIFLLLRPMLLLRGGRMSRYLLTAILVWLYVMLVGCSYSAVRAAVMFCFLLMARGVSQPGCGLLAVCRAAVVILVFSPRSVADVGFQLSFLCVVSICIFVERLNPFSLQTHRRLHQLASLLLLTLTANAATWPVVATYFGAVPLQFFVGNLIAVPLLPLYVCVSGGYLLLAAVGLEPVALSPLVSEPPMLLERLLTWTYVEPLHVEMTPWAMLIWFGGMALAAWSLMSRRPTISRTSAPALWSRPVMMPMLFVGIAMMAFAVGMLIWG